MPRTAKKPQTPPSSPVAAVPVFPENGEVLTLAETAAYLRVPEAEVTRLVQEQQLPGRRIGADWRFLKEAIRQWLSSTPPKGNNDAILEMAGTFKDDPFLEEIVQEIFRQRGRPITEDAS